MTPKDRKTEHLKHLTQLEGSTTRHHLTPPTIRPMTEEDVPIVAALAARCFSEPWSENAYRESLSNPLYISLVACQSEKLLGFADVTLVCDIAYLNHIAVLPDCRGKQIASHLLQSLCSELQQRNVIEFTLEVRPSNLSAVALYQKFGFRTQGRRRNFYRKPTEDALILSRQLQSLKPHNDTMEDHE